MLQEASTLGNILSALLGAAIGLLIGLRWKRPRRWLTFGIILFFALLSPWTMVSAYLVHYGDIIIPFRPVYAAFMWVLVLCFIIRMILKSRHAEVQPE
jgi:hypothetical protein